MTQKNVVDLLITQHAQIKQQFGKVERATGRAREDAFDRLRYLLAVHETAEEEIIHPFARRTIGNGDRIVESVLKEENAAKHTLKELEGVDPNSPDFDPLFSKLQTAVLNHAEHEESTEFPEVKEKATPEQLRGMAAAVEMAEKIAPTHPHPGVESSLKHLALGPVTAVVDRTRDAIQKAMKA
jgi:hemerythrin superfamily protein